MEKKVLAFDYGASSGRAMIGSFDGSDIHLKEIHRFSNDPVSINGTLYWDVLRLFYELKQGILKAKNSGGFDSIGIDTWGVDFGLISAEGTLLENPIHYRDKRTTGMLEEVCKDIDAKELYRISGNQFMEINTIFQLFSLLKNRPHVLQQTDRFLLTPDLFGYLLTGKHYAERSIASTTQLLDPYTKQWNWPLIDTLQLPRRIFAPLVDSGTVVGNLSQSICDELGTAPKPVVAISSHDTACAVAATPTDQEDFIFISCGTWSLFGTELKAPIIGEKSQKYNLTNEVGYGGTTRFLKNIIGLWLIQETRRQFRREGKDYSYADMEKLAKQSKPFACFVDPDAPEFVPQGNIPQRIKEFCKKTGQYIPQTDGEIIRCIYESLAMKYKYAYGQIRECTGKHYTHIHMMGGGTKDNFLCQLTADATGCDVIAGPIEATALGNAAVQLIALGEIDGIKQARQVIKHSFAPIVYTAQQNHEWDKNYQAFKKIIVSK